MPLLRHTRSELLLNVCAALDQAEIDWCVLNGYSTDPDNAFTDVDIVVRPDRFRDVPRAIVKLAGMHVVQCRFHKATSVRYEVLWPEPAGSPRVLGVDVSSDIRALGAVLMSAEEFLTGRRRFKNRLWIPRPCIEFVYCLLRRLAKRALYAQELTTGHEAHLSKLYDEDPRGCGQQLARFFPGPEARFIAAAAARRDWAPIRQDTARLLRAVVRKVWRERPHDVLRYWSGEVPRRILRVLRPEGLMVAVLGADDPRTGSAIGRIQGDLADAFMTTKAYGQAPQLVTTRARWWVAHVVRYWTVIFPRLVRTAFVLVDHRYYAPFADPAGSRGGAPLRLDQVLGWFVPRPHLIILLDGSPDRPASRVQEGRSGKARPVGNCAGRRGITSSYAVDASKPIDEMVADVERIILRYMRERAARRLQLP